MASIESSLKFYQSHMDLLPPSSDDSLGLAFLKVVDDKHGGRFQASYPLSEWMVKFCNKTLEDEKESCMKITKGWTQHKTHPWKSTKVLRGIEPKIELVGTEKEYLWGKLNGECQSALIFKCEVPYLCNITLYDPVPKSMYFLTHQLLQRILTEQSNCESAKKLLNEEVNDQLCSKMYHEARLISKLDYPFILRDVFAEYVGFCGYMGYPNFFREDWLKAILSWQSQSEYGCFTDNNYRGEFITSDAPIVRRQTKDELRQCLSPDSKEELCLPHFTSVSFSALAVSWDYMEENCK
ncbi:hypothetical protein Ocin01_12793 [Orchesella cincta]|uniref:Uncharacterized protein n=1 Tax=Orchesella cincta TaxID=48709 RepID=A0A1D2MLJ5_ORCCI|nr:hypothetical protein Ocin01_12793 [Orchesella cincta]